MTSFLISLPAQQVANILNGEQSLIIMKMKPTRKLPMTGYIYCMKSKQTLLLADDIVAWEFDCPRAKIEGKAFAIGGSIAIQNATWKIIKQHLPTATGHSSGCHKLNGKVIAKFTLREVDVIHHDSWGETFYIEKEGDYRINVLPKACIGYKELTKRLFTNEFSTGRCYAYIISDLVIFDKPKRISEFERVGGYMSVNDCPKKKRGDCNMGYGVKGYAGCERARLTQPPILWQYVEALR